MWDLVNIYNKDFPWYNDTPGYLWQQSICWCFIVISGFSFSLSKRPWLRSVVIFGAGAVITFITVRFIPSLSIWFGILTLIGSCWIICSILNPVLIKFPSSVGIVISALLFFFTREVNNGYLGFEGFKIYRLPSKIYSGYISTYLGFPMPGFFSTDYFSLIPWFFLFITGYFLFKFYDKHLRDKDKTFRVVPILGYVGRDTLYIYLAHQPIIYIVLYFCNRMGLI